MRSKYFLGGLFLGLATAFTLAQEITGDIRGYQHELARPQHRCARNRNIYTHSVA
jgi:hypothetical protein